MRPARTTVLAAAGAGVRVNAFSYAILEFAGVKPFDRPDDSGRVVLNISPGFPATKDAEREGGGLTADELAVWYPT